MFRTLIVDQQQRARELTQKAVLGCDLACDAVADGDLAIKMHDAQPYDAIVTDLQIPTKHGLTLAVDLLDRPRPPRVVVVTELTDPSLVRDLMGRGVDDILYRPAHPTVVAMKLLGISQQLHHRAPPTLAAATNPVEVLDERTWQLAKIEKSLVELTDIFADTLTGLFDFEDDLNDPPRSVSDFVTRFARLEQDEEAAGPQENRRATKRVQCHASVLCVPVTRRFVCCGEPFKAALRDVSEGGIRLLHTRATDAERLALSWSAETQHRATLRLVMNVVRCRPLSPFYDIGGQFVMAD